MLHIKSRLCRKALCFVLVFLLAVTLLPMSAQAADSADLFASITVDNSTPNTGDVVVFTVNLRNNGPDDATGVYVDCPLPTNMTYVSAVPTQGSYEPSTGRWSIGDVDYNDTFKLEITASVTEESYLFIYMRVAGDQDDPVFDNVSTLVALWTPGITSTLIVPGGVVGKPLLMSGVISKSNGNPVGNSVLPLLVENSSSVSVHKNHTTSDNMGCFSYVFILDAVGDYSANIGYEAGKTLITTAFHVSKRDPVAALFGAPPSGIVGTFTDTGVEVAVSDTYNDETATYTCDIDNIQKTAQKQGDGNITFDFTAAELNALPIGTYPISISSTETASCNAISKTVVGDLTVAEQPPEYAEPSNNGITLQAGKIIAGNSFSFTASGDRQSEDGNIVGDTRFVPQSWSVNPSGTFPQGGPYTAAVTIDKPGIYALSVVFMLQQWDGSAWRDTGVSDVQTLDITVLSDIPQTGDNGSMMLWIALGISALGALCVLAWRRRRIITQR